MFLILTTIMLTSSLCFNFIYIAVMTLGIMVTIATCCGCSPSKLAKRRQEEEWKEEIRGMMEKRNREDAEMGLEAEGWTEIHKSKTGPKLVEES